ncbi:MAG: putative electron transport protein YccM [candidate division BRC1 bacterium ADurb.BinA364]|nr:MAG: putative electron transport protein YccM [candidate division BRC1 bacterium ADurb.BinA364]
MDFAALTGALLAASLFAHRWRSRRAMVWLSIFSLGYFGFYRLGCVCPIGAIQNVSRAVFDPSFALPWAVLGFFILPLLFALFFGRVFCGGVCPLGAMQDLVMLKSARAPRWLEIALGSLRHVYLGLAVLFAALGARYVICEFDPFVGFFRMNARFPIWIWSIGVVALSMVVGRPYCRFLCPYGVLLGWFSRFAAKRVTITPEDCVVCHLCVDSCPFGAIRRGGAEEAGEAAR